MPVPALVIERVLGIGSNLAPTALAADIVTLQVPEPVQAPVHSLNSEPEEADWPSVTSVPSSYSASQPAPEPQLIPAGVEVTAPVPVPDLATVSLNLGLTTVLKVAVRVLLASIVKLQGEVVQPAAEPVPAL